MSIDHERLLSIRWVVRVAEKHVNISEGNEAYADWTKALQDSKELVENLTRVHVRDANENGGCEKCNEEAYDHAKELADFDAQLKTA